MAQTDKVRIKKQRKSERQTDREIDPQPKLIFHDNSHEIASPTDSAVNPALVTNKSANAESKLDHSKIHFVRDKRGRRQRVVVVS